MQLIDALLPLVTGSVCCRQGRNPTRPICYWNTNWLEEAETVFFSAVNHLSGLQMAVDVNRIYNMTIRGWVLLRLDRKQEAEKYLPRRAQLSLVPGA